MQYTLAELTKNLDVEIKGDPDSVISGVSPIQSSVPGHITFLTNNVYRKYLKDTKASAVILNKGQASSCPVTAIISSNPHYTYAKIAEFFAEKKDNQSGIDPAAVVAASAKVDSEAFVAANAYIGEDCQIGAGAYIGPGCVIMDKSIVGRSSRLEANVTVYAHVKIGERVTLAAGVVVGSDGFGFANDKGVWHKVPQMGTVIIEDDVDVGANTTIDRGAVEDTVIKKGVKLDNQIQVGHNVVIGEHTIMAGCTGVAGSTTIGKHCMIGGASMILGHIELGDGVMVTGGTGVSKSISEPGVYSSGIVGVVSNEEFRKNNARFRRLESLMQQIKQLEEKVNMLTERQK